MSFVEEIRKGHTNDGIDPGDQTSYLLSPRALWGARPFETGPPPGGLSIDETSGPIGTKMMV